MKKAIALLLCLATVFSLASCDLGELDHLGNLGELIDYLPTQSTTESTDPTHTNTPNEPSEPSVPDLNVIRNYTQAIDFYRKLINICQLQTYVDSKGSDEKCISELGVMEESEKELLSKLLTSAYLFYPGRVEKDFDSPIYKRACGYAIKDLNRDGVDELVLLNNDYQIIAILSTVDRKPVLLDAYTPNSSCWIDGDGYLHHCESNGAGSSSHTVYQIPIESTALISVIEYGMDRHESINGSALTKYYKLTDGKKIELSEEDYRQIDKSYGTYLGTYSGPTATKECSGLVFTPLFSEGAIALQMYEAAINDTVPVFDEYLGEFQLCSYPLNGLPLKEQLLNGKAIIDLDLDGIREYIIQTTAYDTILLHYHDGVVYVFSFLERNLHDLCTDGTFFWRDTTNEGFEYGASKLLFNGSELKIKPIYRIVNDGTPNAQYYIGSKQVDQQKMTSYLKRFFKTRVHFSEFYPYPIWKNRLTVEDALQIASSHWGIKTGDIDEETGYRYILFYFYKSEKTYIIQLAWLVDEHHYSSLDVIEIDAYTGEIYNPALDGKG